MPAGRAGSCALGTGSKGAIVEYALICVIVTLLLTPWCASVSRSAGRRISRHIHRNWRMAMSAQRLYPLSCTIWLVLLSCMECAAAQQSFVLPKAQTLSAGVAGPVPSVLSMNTALPSADGFSAQRIFEILSSAPEIERSTRGAHDIALFRNISPSVVLISTP